MQCAVTVRHCRAPLQCAVFISVVAAIADLPGTLHWLSAASLSNLRQQNPQLALRLMDWVICLLSERVIHAKAEIREQFKSYGNSDHRASTFFKTLQNAWRFTKTSGMV